MKTLLLLAIVALACALAIPSSLDAQWNGGGMAISNIVVTNIVDSDDTGMVPWGYAVPS